MIRNTPPAKVLTMAHCPPSSDGDRIETLGWNRQQRKELAALPHNVDGPGQVSLTGTSLTYGSYMGVTFFYHLLQVCSADFRKVMWFSWFARVFGKDYTPSCSRFGYGAGTANDCHECTRSNCYAARQKICNICTYSEQGMSKLKPSVHFSTLSISMRSAWLPRFLVTYRNDISWWFGDGNTDIDIPMITDNMKLAAIADNMRHT